MVRYADDGVLGFQHRDEAESFQQMLEARLAKFGLVLHPQKTRLLRFGRFAIADAQAAGEGKPESFDFLGFTHLCSHTSLGKFTIRRTTMRKRRISQLKRLRRELRYRMHDPIARTGAWLQRVVQGHINYYGVPFNSPMVSSFCYEVRKSWYRSLCRRSQRKRLNWQRYGRIADYWLPRPRVVHPYPQKRFDANTQGRSRMR